jgi:DNA-binding protein
MSWMADWSGEEPETRLVLIGRKFSLDWVAAVLQTIEEEVAQTIS